MINRSDTANLAVPAPAPANRTPNQPKKLIVCCDGTWRDRDNIPGTPTNVARLARAICNEDDKHYQQIVYYQAGVGTGIGLLNHFVGGGTGLGLAEHVREAYAFLASNYSTLNSSTLPDSIFLIGFSRGAFTARSIGGLLGAVGLLTKKAMPFFHNIFEDWQNAGRRPPTFFDRFFETAAERKHYESLNSLAIKEGVPNIDVYMAQYKQFLLDAKLTQDVKVKCIGVFDTVGALGVPIHPWVQRILPFLPAAIRPYGWFDTRIGDHVENGFHALALDEKRAPYHPTLWELRKTDKSYIKQTWFAGAHSNIGGGYDETGIADITITWMMDHLSGRDGSPDRNTGLEHWIKFDEDYINEYYTKRQKHFLRQVEEGKVDTAWPGWACGPIHNSFSFPHNLTGRRVRTPGRYHFTDYVTGREDSSRLLSRTNESIHTSVRVRIDGGGRAPEPDWRPFPLSLFTSAAQVWYRVTGRTSGSQTWPRYKPMARGQPLQKWRLEDGHKEHDSPHVDATVQTQSDQAVSWQYVGREEGDDSLPEDGLCHYQKMLLSLDFNPPSSPASEQSKGWMSAMAVTARQGFRRPSTF